MSRVIKHPALCARARFRLELRYIRLIIRRHVYQRGIQPA